MRSRTSWMTAILLVAGSSAPGQIDHRVNLGNSGTAGRALDRNPGVGAGGYNLTRPGFDGGVGANAIITGNVTGLGTFQADTPVFQVNQFRASLPSASLSDFHARSVGLGDVYSTRAFAPTYYFDQEQTITDAGYIRQGLNEPGSSRLASPYAAPPQLGAAGRRVLTPPTVFPVRPGSKMVPVAPTGPSTYGAISPPPPPVPSIPLPRPVPSPFRSAVGSSLFGARLPAGPEDGPLDLGPPSGLQPAASDGVVAGPTAERTAATGTKGSISIVGRSSPSPVSPPDGVVPNRPATDAVSPGAAALPSRGGFLVPLNNQTPANLGEDRFADLYNAVGAAQAVGAKRLAFQLVPLSSKPGPVADSTTAPPAVVPPAADHPQDLARERREALDRLAVAAKWAGDLLDDPVSTFVGKNRSRLNALLASGEQAMHMGEYYTAARTFDLANTIDPRNPLPLLGRGHALIAAGDYLSAVRSILQGIARFPQIAAFRLDLPGLVGQRDVFDVRRADLEKQLAAREHCEFRFLLGYVELYSGLPEEGLKDLQRAAKEAPQGTLIADFADVVAGLKEVPPISNQE